MRQWWLRYHLKSQHQIHLGQRVIDLTNPPVSKRQKTLSTVIEKKSQEIMYAELAAVDRFSFFSIAKSQFIRQAMSNNGFNCHVSKHTIRSKVFTYYDEAEAELKAHLKKELEAVKRYSLSFGGEKTAAISQLHMSLLTIPPTSVETERVFSAGGLFLTKLRSASNLSDMSLDKLMFLRFFLKPKTEKVL